MPKHKPVIASGREAIPRNKEVARDCSVTSFLAMTLLVSLLVPLDLIAGTKVDPYISANSSAANTFSFKSTSLEITTRTSSTIEVFVQTKDIVRTKARLFGIGATVKTVVGNIIIAVINAEKAEELAGGAEIIFVEAGKPLGMKTDVAIPEINADAVHAGAGLSGALTGKNIIVGLVDVGIDLEHEDFKNADGKSRVLSVWNQNDPVGPAPKEFENSYGTECDGAAIAAGSCPVGDPQGHGTHVAGIMAARNDTYGGVAPDANIIAVIYDSSVNFSTGVADTIFSTKICEAANYIFTKAGALGRPAVVNLSLGTHIGPHDGTSLFEKCLSNLVRGQAGRAIVAAAGNEYSSDPLMPGIHAGYSIDGTAATNFVIKKISADRLYYIDVWTTGNGEISAGLAVHSREPDGPPTYFTGLIPAGGSKKGALLSGKSEKALIIYNINAEETKSALNGKQHIGITITLDDSLTEAPPCTFDLVVSGKGIVDAWIYPDKPLGGISFTQLSGKKENGWNYEAGDSLKTIAIPATSPDVIAVAAYTSRNEWQKDGAGSKVNYALGDLVPFSSSGPAVDPSVSGNKPDIAAPGAMVASSLSSSFKPDARVVMDDGKHAMQVGTSMAAPFVSGTIALMFEANPNFTSEDVKRYLIESAYSDDFAKELPSPRWGSGKLDSLKAIELAAKSGASGKFSGTPQNSEVEAEASSSSGCTLMVSSAGGNVVFSAWFFMAAVFALAVFMRGVCRR